MKKVLAVLLVLLLCVSLMTGCKKEKVTAESLILAVTMNTKDAKSMSANMVMDLQMSYDMEDVSGSMNIEMDMDMDLQLEPMASYMNVAMNMDADGMTETQNYEVYTVLGDNESEVKIYTGMEEMWYVETADMEENTDFSEQLSLAAGMAENEDVSFELAEETQTINDKEVYVLTGTMKGETLQEMMASLKEMEELLGSEIDMSNAQASMEYYIDKETKMPVQMNIDMSEFMSSILGDTGIIFDAVTVEYVFESFDNVTVEVPEEVVSNAMDATAMEESLGGEETAYDENLEYEEDTLLNTTDTSVVLNPAAADAPAAMNEWVSTYALLKDGSYFQIGAKVVGIERGESVDELVKSVNESAGSEVLGALHENLEYCLVAYEVYVPTDFPEASFSGVEMYLTDTEGKYFETEYEFDDMYWVEVVDDTHMNAAPGETAKIVGIYTMEKDRTEYMIEIGDSWFHESYIKINE